MVRGVAQPLLPNPLPSLPFLSMMKKEATQLRLRLIFLRHFLLLILLLLRFLVKSRFC